MRTFLRVIVLTLAFGTFMPEVALGQEDEPFDDEAPPPRALVRQPRKSWKRSPIVWGTVAVVCAVALPFGVIKLLYQMRQWQADQTREKEPWERAMADAERKRMN